MVTNNIVVYIKSDVKTCQARDYKGVYEKAIRGEIKNFTGIRIFMKSQNMQKL